MVVKICIQTGDSQERVFKLVRPYITWYIWIHALEIVADIKKNFDNDGQQKSEPKAAKHSLSTRPSSFPNVFQRAAEEIVLYLKNSSNRIIQIVAKSKQEKSISVIKRNPVLSAAILTNERRRRRRSITRTVTK